MVSGLCSGASRTRRAPSNLWRECVWLIPGSVSTSYGQIPSHLSLCAPTAHSSVPDGGSCGGIGTSWIWGILDRGVRLLPHERLFPGSQ